MSKKQDYLPESLLFILDYYKPSGIEFFCTKEETNMAMRCFQEHFTEGWYREFPEAAERFGYDWDDEEIKKYMEKMNPVPLEISSTDYGFYARIGNLTIISDFDPGYTGETAVFSALHAIEKKYPDISYRGYIGWIWYDAITNTPSQWECHAGKTTECSVYESVKQALNEAVLDGDFWEQMIDEAIDEPENELVSFLKLYSEGFDSDYIKYLTKAGKGDPEREKVVKSILVALKV